MSKAEKLIDGLKAAQSTGEQSEVLEVVRSDTPREDGKNVLIRMLGSKRNNVFATLALIVLNQESLELSTQQMWMLAILGVAYVISDTLRRI